MDDDLARWLSRLPLAERLNLQRRDEEAAALKPNPNPRPGLRCAVCGVRLDPSLPIDILQRCRHCAKNHRLEPRRRKTPVDAT